MSKMRAVVAFVAVAGITSLALGVLIATGPDDPYYRGVINPTPSPRSNLSPSPSPSPEPEDPTLAWGPSEADWIGALETARELPLERAAGQVIVAAYASTSTRGMLELVADHHLGGVIVMGPAVTDATGVRSLTSAAQAGVGPATGR